MEDAINFTIDSAHVEGMLAEEATRLGLLLQRRVDVVTLKLESQIKGEKLQGEVLQSHTGNLADSVRAIPAEVNGDLIQGFVTAGGGVVNYAGIQNYGVDHPWVIEAQNAQALRFQMGGVLMFRRKVTIPGLPARNFMESTLGENEAYILAELKDAANEGIRP